MHDAGTVRSGQRVRDLQGNVDGPTGAQPALGEIGGERLPVHELHDHVGAIAVAADVEHRNNAGVVQR